MEQNTDEQKHVEIFKCIKGFNIVNDLTYCSKHNINCVKCETILKGWISL